MKKLFFMSFLAVLFVVACPVMVMAAPLGIDEVANPGNYQEYFASVAAFLSLVPIATEFLKRLVGARKFGAQLLSWTVGIIIGFLASALSLGIFDGLIWWQIIVVGLGGSLAANGIFDTGIITWLINLILPYSDGK